MIRYRSVVLGLAAATVLACPIRAPAQVSFNVGIGGPACPYGYFAYPPYGCAPFGYYGPEWFRGGAFIGAGPWFHGPRDFRGPVNTRFDPRGGYRGPLPRVGSRRDPRFNVSRSSTFRGNARINSRGRVG